ncbi:hypothetical protein GGR51DRAFT_566614 [Nemania sp. FL0031]|nr:hypothetical protein GGR51DRAFT_566614 [Nemania sp. FL0031]
MKYIRYQSDRLGMAPEREEDLRKEIASLQKELALLKPNKRRTQPRTSSCSEKTAQSPQTPIAEHRYAQSTAASRGKLKSQPQSPTASKEKESLLVMEKFFGTELYRYKDGVPIQMPFLSFRPKYMGITEASRARTMATEKEYRNRLDELSIKRSMRRPRRFEGSWDLPGHTDHYKELHQMDEFKFHSECPTPPLSDTEDDSKLDDSLEKRSRLRDDLYFGQQHINIDSKTGFDLLRRAAEIAQEVIHAVGESGHEAWPRFRGGPHEVKLGRNELMAWLGECPQARFALNGKSASTVFNAVLDVVPLRNAVCHPCGNTFEAAESVDRLIRLSQALAVTLGDEKRAFEVRQLRDDLRDEANRSVQDVLDLYYMSTQPYSPGIECKYHHVKLFKYLLLVHHHRPDPEGEGERRALDVARAWENMKETSSS